MNALQLLRSALGTETRFTIDDYAQWMQESFLHGGIAYGTGLQTTLGSPESPGESIEEHNFAGRVRTAYKSNGVIFACQVARMLVFTEARFAFRKYRNGRPGSDLTASDALEPLRRPWPNGNTGTLLARALQDVDIVGNFFGRRAIVNMDNVLLERLRPDWVVIQWGLRPGLAAPVVLGYLYWPEGPNGDADPMALSVDEVVHWAPITDPEAKFRGMSWLTPIVRETLSDSAASTHKLKFFENGATPNLVISYDANVKQDQFMRMKAAIEAETRGLDRAYRTLHLGGGADVTLVGSTLQQMDFKNVQGHGETRICAAARVPPVIVGLSEGLQAATYSNYGQARRHFADSWARPMWRSVAGALETIIDVPANSELWYDASDISFLQEDRKDAAAITQVQAATIANLVREGFTPESAVAAVLNEDLSLLVHTGKVSVQLTDPNAEPEPEPGEVPPELAEEVETDGEEAEEEEAEDERAHYRHVTVRTVGRPSPHRDAAVRAVTLRPDRYTRPVR